MKQRNHQSQKGSVAIFVVIFTSLFVTIVTVSFVSVMLKNQTQATNADLAESAYDSALAGVEDGKRAMQKFQSCTVFTPGTDCARAKSAVENNQGDGVKKFITGNSSATGEMELQSTSGSATDDKKLSQAYTCVKITGSTSLEGSITTEGQFEVVPLALASSDLGSLKISWYTKSDNNNTSTLSLTSSGSGTPLYADGSWPANRPPVLRTQFVATNTNFSLTEFDLEASPRKTSTVFLYPWDGGTPNPIPDPDTASILPAGYPSIRGVRCYRNATDYFCSAKLQLVTGPITVSPSQPVYLILAPLYKGTHYKIEAFAPDGTTRIVIENVKNIDSTGRANDLFRRVRAQTRLDGGAGVIYPTAAVETNKLCKDFSVTNVPGEFEANSTCNPATL